MIENNAILAQIMLNPPEPTLKKEVMNDYLSYVLADDSQQTFASIFSKFLLNFFSSTADRPKRYIFCLHHDPESEKVEPMVHILYPEGVHFDPVRILKTINSAFKSFLENYCRGKNNIAKYSQVYRKYRIIIDSE